MMKCKLCALLLALLLALGLTACRFEWELGGLAGGVHLELQNNDTESWPTAGSLCFA